jgi:hypothetical protein
MAPKSSFAFKIPLPAWAMMLMLLAAVLSLLLGGVYVPGMTLFSNDGPLGNLVAECHRLPGRFLGCWHDLNYVGYRDATATPGISYGLQFLLGPVLFSKLYAILGLMVLGLGAWCCFRQLGFNPPVCLLGGLAATLNADFFSAACWGVAAHPITVGMSFFALAALLSASSAQGWRRGALVVLAGLAAGMGVTEGADIGAIFSLYIAAFAIWQVWVGNGTLLTRLSVSTGRVLMMAVCAALLATNAILGFVSIEIEGVVATSAAQGVETPAERWDWATQWSLPKREALGFLVPGLFGYRMDSTDGGVYWGAIGRDPAWDRYQMNGRQGTAPSGFQRYSGGGFYAGVLTVLLVIWAAVQSFRRRDSIFSSTERKWIWFWLAAGLVSLLLAFGRFAPFYRWFYSLPYASTIRNPTKFLHPLSFALVVLFAYGLDGLWRKYMRQPLSKPPLGKAGQKVSQPRLGGFEKAWVYGCLVALGLSLLAWRVYSNSYDSVQSYLLNLQFDENDAYAIPGFSVRQVGWFTLFFGLAAGLISLILRGTFSGTRARWGVVLLGLLLVLDLGRANLPWIVYWDCPKKYASNPIIDILREKPHEHRVALTPLIPAPELSVLRQIYRMGWLQQQFPFYNIQSLDVVQLSRAPKDLTAFEERFRPRDDPASATVALVGRRWELTNTRYVLGPTKDLDFMNRSVDPVQHRFRIVERFEIAPQPGITLPRLAEDFTAVPNPDGSYALFEFTGALPRAKLYSNWQINTNNQATLDQLASTSFDPEQTVLVAGGLAALPRAPDSPQMPGTVELESYAPKEIHLKADAANPAVLLLNDRFDPHWNVVVDGKPEMLLLCNYFMRGVYLAPGTHEVEFRFQEPAWSLFISLAALGAGLVLLGLVLNTSREREQPKPNIAGQTRSAAMPVRSKSVPKA